MSEAIMVGEGKLVRSRDAVGGVERRCDGRLWRGG